MARDATARLYDVDDDALVFKRFGLTNSYDQGTITFQAKRGQLISLDKLHESIWATRLSGGTNSGVVCLEAIAVGTVVTTAGEVILRVRGSDREFVLVNDVGAKPAEAKPGVLESLRRSTGGQEQLLQVTGYVEDWSGRWPGVLKKAPATRPRLMVTSFQEAGESTE